MIAVSNLHRRFDSRVAVEDVTFEVAASEIVALLGPNGAGKTTTMRMMAGLIAPTSGSVVVDGIVLTPGNGNALRQRIGFLTESPGLWDRLTVRENLHTYAGLYGLRQPDRKIDAALDLFGIRDRADARAAELSKGTRQKVALARALLHDPKVLLLDEPTSGLDPEVTRSVRLLLEERRAQGCAILISTHNLDEADRLADRIAVVQTRLLALDTPARLRLRLRSDRTIVRVRGRAEALIAVARRSDPHASAAGDTLTLALSDHDSEAPALVRAIVESGGQVIEVRREVAPLEEVYLRLVQHPVSAAS